MKWLVIALIILFILLVIIIIISKITIILEYYHGNDNDHLKLEFKLWFGLIKYKKEIPMIKIDDNSPTVVFETETQTGQSEKKTKEDKKQVSKEKMSRSLKDFETILKHVVNLHSIVRNFLKKVRVRDIEWHTAIGVGDAAYTGMMAGGLWAIKGGIISIISNYTRLLEMPRMSVTPFFQQTISQTRFKCMIQFRIGQAMLAGLKLIKFWKGGRPDFKTKPLSVLSK